MEIKPVHGLVILKKVTTKKEQKSKTSGIITAADVEETQYFVEAAGRNIDSIHIGDEVALWSDILTAVDKRFGDNLYVCKVENIIGVVLGGIK